MSLIAVVADPHLDNWDRFAMDPFVVDGLDDAIKGSDPDLLIVAGDISNNPLWMWTKALKRLGQIIPPQKIIIIPGNHDYYGFRLDGDHLLREMCSDVGMRFAQKEEIRIGKTRLLCCTLWTDFALIGNVRIAVEAAARVMNDYRHIETAKVPGLPFNQQDTRHITPKDTLRVHHDHRAWLETALRAPHFAGDDGRTVVVTHHGPSRSTAAGAIDEVTPSFHSDLDDLIKETAPDAWFFGHSHRRCRAIVGKTDVRCVSIGYRHERGHQTADELQSMMFFETG